MAYNKVVYGGTTLIDLSGDTLSTADQLLKGIVAHNKAGERITGTAEQGGGGGLPSGISKLTFGTDNVTSAFTTTRRTVTHNLSVVPDLVIYWHSGNVAQAYSMLMAMRSSQMGYRSGYDSYYVYHGNNTSNVTVTNSNNASYGVGNLTSTTFQVASSSTSYYWRAGTYNWIAIKFS